VDLVSAYDKVDRRTLMRLVTQKRILHTDQLQLLNFLMTNATTQYGNHQTTMTNGVPQGSTLSPILFNIFVEALGERIKQAGISFRFYADDLIIIGDDETIRRVIPLIDEWTEANNMAVNKTKSGILAIDGSGLREGEDIDGYPVVGSYKYLGLLVNGRLDLRSHLAQINRKAGFIAHRLYGLRTLDNLRLNINLFTIFVMPHYRLALTLYTWQSETAATKLDTHMRVWYKKFVRIPINTAGRTFELIAGDLKAQAKASHNKIKRRLKQRQDRDPGDRADRASTGLAAA
jgi:hypothetical protein